MAREKEKKKSGEQQRRRSVPALFQRGRRQSTTKQEQQSKNDDDTAEGVVVAVVDGEASEQIEDTTDDDLKQLGQLQNGTGGGSFGKRRTTTLLPAKSVSNNGIRRLSFQNLGGRNRRYTTASDNTDNNSNDSQSRKSSVSGRRRSSVSQIMFGMKRPKIKKLLEKNDFDQIRELLVEGSSNRKSLTKWLEECTDVRIIADHIHSCFFDDEDAIIPEQGSHHQPADDPDKNGNDLEGNGYNNMIALHLALERHPPIDVVEEFIDLLPDNIMIHCDSMGQTPLHVACRWGAGSEIISQLLEYSNEEKVVLVNKLDNSGRTPLHHACIISGLSIDQCRKEQGTYKGSKKRANKKKTNGYSHDYADSGDDHHSIESCVDASVSTTGNKSINSMSAAERLYEKEQDMLKVIQILIEIDPKCVLKRDKECRKTPYDYAIEQKSSAEIIDLLKSKS